MLFRSDVGGRAVYGHCDLYDRLSGFVWDWKSKSKTQLLNHRRHGLGEKYIVQAQLYGHAWHRMGFPVNGVGCIFFPRDGEWDEIFARAIPFDPAVAQAALLRADGMARLLTAVGFEAALELYGSPVCEDRWCRFCPAPRAFRPDGAGDPNADPFAI